MGENRRNQGSLFGTEGDRELQVIQGRVERVIFRGKDDGYRVVELRKTGEGSLSASITLVGRMPGIEEGLEVKVSGTWVKNPRFGKQFRVSSYALINPRSKEGIAKYLGSGAFNGIGPVLAARLVDCFGPDTLDIIQNHPERLEEVPGIGSSKAEAIVKAWKEQEGTREVMSVLASHGVPPNMAARIYKRYGADSLKVLKDNPYRLVEDIQGIGFLTADNLASDMGVDKASAFRARAGLVHVLKEAESKGHVFLPKQELLAQAADLLGPERGDLDDSLGSLLHERRLVLDRVAGLEAVYLPDRLWVEERIAAMIARMVSMSENPTSVNVEALLKGYEARTGMILAREQKEAVRTSLRSQCTVVTGGPGTGKTTLVKAIVHSMKAAGLRPLLCAPTGRAAKRLSEAASTKAKTIHRLLEYAPGQGGGFRRNQENPLKADMIIVDEVSMVDMDLFRHLLEAMPKGCRLLLVGDEDQLPSVGPGRVLFDLIDSGVLAVVRLERIFRQAEKSNIVKNAHKILRGDHRLEVSHDRQGDFYFIEREDPEQALETIKVLVSKKIPGLLDVDPLKEVQVLTPMRRGTLGTDNLNQELKSLLNPNAGEGIGPGRSFNTGDRVMQVRNNYDLQVFNGEVGRVIAVSTDGKTMDVDFEDRVVRYDAENLNDLVLAFACTVHKAQGSEYMAVVVVLHTQHYMMLRRNLLYTAVTRGKRLVVVVGSAKALRLAVANDRVERRYTGLSERIKRTAAKQRLPL